jgi:hypothetical protein
VCDGTAVGAQARCDAVHTLPETSETYACAPRNFRNLCVRSPKLPQLPKLMLPKLLKLLKLLRNRTAHEPEA